MSTTTDTWNLATSTYTGKSVSVTSQETNPRGLTFRPDGTSMYVIGYNTDTIYQYTLTSPWDVSTASYASLSKSVTIQETFPENIFFRHDGTSMYVIGSTNRTIYQYTLTTPWDVSTASYASTSKYIGTEESTPTGLFFRPDGTSMYVNGLVADRVYQYTLTTPWDVSTASYASLNKSVTAQDSDPYSVTFRPDGAAMYVMGSTNDTVYQYTLTTPWDVSTASYASTSKSVTSQDGTPLGLTFRPDGTAMYMVGTTNDTVYQYALPGGMRATGTMTGTSAFNDVQVLNGGLAIQGNASTSNLTIDSTATVTLPTYITLSKNFTNSGYSLAPATEMTVAGHYTNNRTAQFIVGTTTFSSSTAQTIAGVATGTSAFASVAFTGASTKTFSATQASTTNFVINSGATVVAPASRLSVSGLYSNSGTFTHNSGTTSFTGTSRGWNVSSSTTYTGKSKLVSAQESTPRSIAFRPDGTGTVSYTI
jgi:sugar lactone lactonase YvrE